jgi:Protein of unknown function (DUF3987)
MTEPDRVGEAIQRIRRSKPSANGAGPHPAKPGNNSREPWTEPLSLGGEDLEAPPFPVDCLPPLLREWVIAVSEHTQTPHDLPGMVALPILGAGLAKKFRVQIRNGWSQPTNLYCVTSLPPSDRKSPVFNMALSAVTKFEAEERQRMAPIIAGLQAEHRILENSLKSVEGKAAKAEDLKERGKLREEAKRLARELDAHIVPVMPRLFIDNTSMAALGKEMAQQGGRLLIASAEGVIFDICKGQLSDGRADFDPFLKGYDGDPYRVTRISCDSDIIEQPALSCAITVQPMVIAGLAEEAGLAGRGFLARWLYSLPKSRVGSRQIAPDAVPAVLAGQFENLVLSLWRLPGNTSEKGEPCAHFLMFSVGADDALREFERWLEPQLAEDQPLGGTHGWAGKLAGSIARIAAIFHMIKTEGRDWNTAISVETVQAAIILGRDYLLPHALAAFAQMGADAKVALARKVVDSIRQNCEYSEYSEYSEYAPPVVTRRDLHQWNRRAFKSVEGLDPILEVLVSAAYLRPPNEESSRPGRGHRSPSFEVNPSILAAKSKC